MNKKRYAIKDNTIKFHRIWIFSLMKNLQDLNLPYNEIYQIINSLLNKIEFFEKKLSENFQQYALYETEVDKDYINHILHQQQIRIRYFVNICIQQEFKHLIL